MNAQKLRELLEKTNNKLSIFASIDILEQYDFNMVEFFSLISDFLSDEEKIELIKYPHFKGNESSIIGCISDENKKLEMLRDDSIISNFENYQIIDIIVGLSENKKQQILYDRSFIEKYNFSNDELLDIILTLSNNGKVKILEIEQLEFNKDSKMQILNSLDILTLCEFLKYNKEFCTKNNIHLYEIVTELDSERQRELVEKLESMNLTLGEKKEILVTLNCDVKQIINSGDFSQEYKNTIRIPTKYRNNRIEVLLDPNIELETYRGLDKLMRPMFAEQFTEEQRNTFMQLCDICPNLKVISSLSNESILVSTGAEYKEAEEWITSILDNLDPKYSKAQKIAVIDNAIGKKISYTPDKGTEVFDEYDSRALWKIISSGYGVCNGIARVEQYILERIGISSEIVSSDNHAFLKLKDIELPLANGQIKKGNTILDPTWNLASHKFGGKPNSFCISYEEARKNDIDTDGKDHNCHKNDEELKDATLSLDEQSLRQLFTSVGLADKDGKFPINELIEKSRVLDKIYKNQPNENIFHQFLLISQVCPEFAICQEETMTILKDILLNNENLEFNICIINRVYDKTDREKKPILYVYIDSNELGEKFYFADKNKRQFIELPQEEFINQYECYEEDLKNSKRS